jgi:hypothetical protein
LHRLPLERGEFDVTGIKVLQEAWQNLYSSLLAAGPCFHKIITFSVGLNRYRTCLAISVSALTNRERRFKMFRIEVNGRTFLLTTEELFRLLEKLPRDQTINVVDIVYALKGG